MQNANQRWRVVAITVLALTLLGASAITHALSCASRLFTLSEAYEAADSIIVGLITECEEEVSRDPWASGGANCVFTSLEVLKDSVPARDYGGVTSSSGCGLSLQVGAQYLLFLDSENRPLRFSAPLGSDQHQAELAGRHLKILRDYRNGQVDDMAEPWIYNEHMGTCSVYHGVAGNQISFHKRRPGAPKVSAPPWTEDSIEGQTVYRATVPFYDLNTQLPSGEGKLVAFGSVPDLDSDALILRVSLQEQQPPPMRQGAISVGNRTWSLMRLETIVDLSGASAHKSVQYYAYGKVAEQILAAMLSPSDITVSARVVAMESNDNETEIAPPKRPSLGVFTSNGDFFGQTAPGSSATRPSQTAEANGPTSNSMSREAPESELRFESRSTQLLGVIDKFEACYAGGGQ